MPVPLAHFAITAEDVTRARQFYETVFGWTFEPWGPPNFFQIRGAGIHGALQERRPDGVPPTGGVGIECTFAVLDLDAVSRAITAAGGELLDQLYEIPTVGRLRRFADTERNELIVMQYLPAYAEELGLQL